MGAIAELLKFRAEEFFFSFCLRRVFCRVLVEFSGVIGGGLGFGLDKLIKRCNVSKYLVGVLCSLIVLHIDQRSICFVI